jgi:hypothetical protein
MLGILNAVYPRKPLSHADRSAWVRNRGRGATVGDTRKKGFMHHA